MISKTDLAEGIRFAGKRAAAAAENTRDWDHQLGHQWTSADAFRHLAATAGACAQMYPMLGGEMLTGLGAEQIAGMNAQSIAGQASKSHEEIVRGILDGSEASAKFVETLDEGDLATVVKLGGYEMPKAELVAQVWIHHQIAHAYEASARWPLT